IRRLSVFNRKVSPTSKDRAIPSDAPTRDLPHFLELQKVNYRRALEHRQAKQWTVVMGNEAGDLDSVASAFAFAWYASTHLSQLTIPLLQTPREDLHLRAENLYALEHAGVKPDILLTGDEMPAPTGESFALVDHNCLAARFIHISSPPERDISSTSGRTPSSPLGVESKVTAIIDHHEDEGAHLDADPRIVEPAGSCSSLVTRLLKAVPDISLPQELAFLLLSAIVIDTHALKDGGKAIAVDHDAANWLIPLAGLESIFPSAFDQSKESGAARALRELSDMLHSKKSDIEHLSPRDLLRRDYKEYTFTPSWDPSYSLHAGLATVPRGLKGWLADLRPRSSASASASGRAHENFWDACVAYMDLQKLDILGVLTTWRDDSRFGGRGRHRREQAWLVRSGSSGNDLQGRLWAGLEGCDKLRLKKKDGKRYTCELEGFASRVYEQGDASATRKVTAPLLREIVEGT
ncbi:hypothetical protein K488DRAFT_37867, partial [Vararia minispora EC-137]